MESRDIKSEELIVRAESGTDSDVDSELLLSNKWNRICWLISQKFGEKKLKNKNLPIKIVLKRIWKYVKRHVTFRWII